MTVSFRSKYQVIPGCTGRSGKNTGCRPEIENRPVKCKVVNQRKKKKDTQIPTVASTFLVATPLPLLLLLLLSSSGVAPLMFLWTFFAFCFYFSSERRLVKSGGVPWHHPRQLGQFKFQIDFYIFLILKGHKFQRHLNVQTCIPFVKDASDLPLQLQIYYYYYY